MTREELEQIFIEGSMAMDDRDMVLTPEQLDDTDCFDLFPVYASAEHNYEKELAMNRFAKNQLFIDRGIKYQAAIPADVPIKDVLEMFGTVESSTDENGGVYITRGYESPEHLKTLLGTLQSRLERKGKHMRGSLIQPLGVEASTKASKYNVKGPLKARMDYGTYSNPKMFTLRTPFQNFYAGKILEHPDTVIIPPNEFYPHGLTEQQIASYYDSVSNNIVSSYAELDLDGYTVIKVDDRMVIKRHAGVEVLSMKVGDHASFDALNSGRAVEFHFAVGGSTRAMWIDLDPKEGFPWEEVKRTAANILEIFSNMERVVETKLNFSGRNGFHVYAVLEHDIDVDEARNIMGGVAQAYIKELGDDRLTVDITKRPNTMRLDVTTLHATGGLRTSYSLAYPTGLVCLPLTPNQLATFEKDQATIYKVLGEEHALSASIIGPRGKESTGQVINLIMNWITKGELPKYLHEGDQLLEMFRKKEEGDDHISGLIVAQILLNPVYNATITRKIMEEGKTRDVTSITHTNKYDYIMSKAYELIQHAEVKEMGEDSTELEGRYVRENFKDHAILISKLTGGGGFTPEEAGIIMGYYNRSRSPAQFIEFCREVLGWGEISPDVQESIIKGVESAATVLKMEEDKRNKEHDSGYGKIISSLEKYQQKRKFDATAEPAGKEGKDDDKVFVIQEHNAHKAGLHYDFRLSDHGVLKSWAVRKLPDALQGKLVLAKEVEDHPLEYAAFEGEIPSGQYGAGKVTIWDSGGYDTISRDDKKWQIRLHGEQLNGPFVLINTGNNNWLLKRITDK